MAKEETTTEAKGSAGQSVNLQLVPSNGSDQPVFANVTMVQPTAGVALIDFGFLDPGAMNVLQRMASAGKKVPERVNGRLATRIALSYEALAALQRQINAVLLQTVAKRETAQ
jgi:hypothetical protein